jgi:hypothetical protein
MRMAFGLIGLLVTIGVIVMIMNTVLKKEQAVFSASKTAREEVTQIGGYSEDQTPAQNSVTFEPTDTGGRFDALRVTAVIKNGAMDKFYGLRANDVVVEINGLKAREVSNGDPELAQSLVIDAFRASQPITVVRDGQRVTLPLPATPPSAAAPAPAPSKPAEEKQSLSKQIESIQERQKTPTH